MRQTGRSDTVDEEGRIKVFFEINGQPRTVRVPKAGLAGSGPAYIFLVAEALMDAGVLAGLSRADSEALTTQLLVGSAALLRERGEPARLRTQVTSPGGTTAAGLRVLEEHAVRSAFLEAVMAATRRSVELGTH